MENHSTGIYDFCSFSTDNSIWDVQAETGKNPHNGKQGGPDISVHRKHDIFLPGILYDLEDQYFTGLLLLSSGSKYFSSTYPDH